MRGSSPRMTSWNSHAPNHPAAPHARGFALKPHPPRKSEGAGKTGCAPHPRSRAQLLQRSAAPEHTGLAEASGLPCAMALRLIRDRPGDPAFCDTIALKAALAAFELDACIGASDPHDFAVRQRPPRLATSGVHRSPSHAVTIASAPTGGMGCMHCAVDSTCAQRKMFSSVGIDSIGRRTVN
jgi:hypothetical protein